MTQQLKHASMTSMPGKSHQGEDAKATVAIVCFIMSSPPHLFRLLYYPQQESPIHVTGISR
jgi:hypothetical protein